MAKTKFVIVGGVAGGATAAARMRRLSEEAEIVLFEKGEYISYANCGLPYYIGGVIEERDKLFVQTPEAFGKRFNIDVRTNSEVTAIDTEQRQVTVKTTDGKTYTERYDKLLLSPGASPVVPPLPGIQRALKKMPILGKINKNAVSFYACEQFSDIQIPSLF